MQSLDFVMITAVIVYFHALVINMAQKYNVLSLSDFCRSCVMPTRFLGLSLELEHPQYFVDGKGSLQAKKGR